MEFSIYSLEQMYPSLFVPKIVPATKQREWIEEESPTKHGYKCVPLSIASTYGWEMLSPCAFSIEFDGNFANPSNDSIIITALDGYPHIERVVQAHFRQGTITFLLPFIFKTPAGYNTFITGPLNSPKDNIYPMSAIVETDWLPFNFGMTWKMTRKGTAYFKKDEPFLRFFPIKREKMLEDWQVSIENIENNPLLKEHYLAYNKTKRSALEAAAKIGKHQPHPNYVLGTMPDPKSGEEIKIEDHYNNLNLQTPIRK